MNSASPITKTFKSPMLTVIILPKKVVQKVHRKIEVKVYFGGWCCGTLGQATAFNVSIPYWNAGLRPGYSALTQLSADVPGKAVHNDPST